MKQKILVASNNQHKIEEIFAILSPLGYEVISMKEAGIQLDIEENGTSFAENAILKVEALREYGDFYIIADDSGIEFECLNGLPGIYSARFLGEDTPYDIKNQLILKMMEMQENRKARFFCCIAILIHDKIHTFEAYLDGSIAHTSQGKYGFGYDPIFYLSEYHCHLAELVPIEKNKISHRSKALQMLEKFLKGGEDEI